MSYVLSATEVMELIPNRYPICCDKKCNNQ